MFYVTKELIIAPCVMRNSANSDFVTRVPINGGSSSKYVLTFPFHISMMPPHIFMIFPRVVAANAKLAAIAWHHNTYRATQPWRIGLDSSQMINYFCLLQPNKGVRDSRFGNKSIPVPVPFREILWLVCRNSRPRYQFHDVFLLFNSFTKLPDPSPTATGAR